MTAIAKAAKVSRNTFYQHFAGKDAILREMMHTMWDDVLQDYKLFSELPDWTEPSISGWLNEYFNYSISSVQRYRIVTQNLPEELSAQSASREWRSVKALIGNSSRWNRFPQEEAYRRARLLIYLLERISMSFHAGNLMTEREALIQTLTEIWLSTLQRPRRKSSWRLHDGTAESPPI